VRYDGQKVVRVSMPESDHLTAVQRLVEELNLDVWQSFHGRRVADIRVPDNATLGRLASIEGVSFETMIEDIQQLIDEETRYHATPQADWWATFHSYQDIVTFVTGLTNDYPNLASLQVIGQSREGRNMHILKLKGTGGPGVKPIIFIQSLIHAREWITGAVTTWFMNQLTSLYGTDATVTKLMDNFEWHFIPVTNPDGYAFTWATNGDRLWRKNRNPNGGGGNCYGVDNNRNYKYKWAGGGSTCTETYPGLSAGSELENINSDNYFKTLTNVKGFVDVHAYGQYVLYPYGYTNQLPPDQIMMEEVGIAMQQAIYGVNKLLFTEGNAAPTLYATMGDSIDWTYGTYGVKLSYVIENRDNGRYGFVLPASQILPAAREIYAAFVALANYILAH